ncbi:MAG: hypothetical protein BJ554DRAFT_3156 [Olpidium bornovanus]|uniref:Kinesin motor domain-containing protein n=1 Tax=Olpidium bornovanus TaxID=278681 RepID=A0A8H7ZPP2_9FUNG|nr:MAG: hypothetical protein BJ554DRAFT_3156 [Olpidium bornovanus]
MKRITTKGSGLSKNIRASLWINTLSPSQSPVPVGGDDLPLLRARHDQEPPAPLQQQQQQQHPVHPRRHHDPLHHNHHPQQQPSAQATARQASLAGYAGFEIGDAGLLPPLSFQVKNPQPSFMVVTPAHLRRPGPHSPGLAHAPALPGADAAYSPSSRSHSTATLSDARLSPPPPPSRPHRKGREKMPAAAVRSEITIAVRVKPAIAPARWPQWMSSGSDRPCLLIERPRPAPRGGGSGLFAEAVTPRQMQTLALLEKLENKRDAGGVGENGDIGGGNLPAGDAGGAKTKLFVTVPRFVQGAISTTTTTRKFSSFDHVFDGDASQSDVYAGISSLVDGLLSEIASADNPKAANCLTFVASGYPSAGKSYTLFGPAHNDDDDDAAAQRKTPQVPAKRSSSRPSLMPHEVELAQPTDGLLQRAVARILASSAGPVSMSFAQLVRVFDALWMQSARESEHVVDLLTGEEKHGIERENFWEALAKAHVRSLPDVNHWLQEGRRLAGNDDRHVVVAFEFSAPGGRTRRLVMVDAAVENMVRTRFDRHFARLGGRATVDSSALGRFYAAVDLRARDVPPRHDIHRHQVRGGEDGANRERGPAAGRRFGDDGHAGLCRRTQEAPENQRQAAQKAGSDPAVGKQPQPAGARRWIWSGDARSPHAGTVARADDETRARPVAAAAVGQGSPARRRGPRRRRPAVAAARRAEQQQEPAPKARRPGRRPGQCSAGAREVPDAGAGADAGRLRDAGDPHGAGA